MPRIFVRWFVIHCLGLYLNSIILCKLRVSFCGCTVVACGLRRFPSTEKEGQMEDHSQNLEATYAGSRSSPSFACLC